MGFDLGQIETRKFVEEGKLFPIRRQIVGEDGATTMEPVLDDKGEQLQIKISGADASRIKNAVEQRQRARRAALEAVKPGETPPDINGWEIREQDIVDDLVLLTEGWTDNFELDGKPFPFSKDNAAILYKRFPDIAQQMTEIATTRVNFLPASSKK